MQAEVPVQVDHVVLRYGDTRTLAVVQGVAVRHDHVESVHGAALEQTNQHAAVRRTGGRTDGKGGSREEQRIQAQTE